MLMDASAPLVSVNSLDNANLPSCGGSTVTVSGLNFGGYNCTATASMATSENCLSTTWTSVTTAVCATQSRSGGVLRSSVIARGVTSTGWLSFSFDGMKLKHAFGVRLVCLYAWNLILAGSRVLQLLWRAHPM